MLEKLEKLEKINSSISIEKPIKGLDPEYLRYAAWAALRLGNDFAKKLRPVHLYELLSAEQTLAARVLAQPTTQSSADVVDAILLDRMKQCTPGMRAIVASVWFYRQLRNGRGELAVDLAQDVLDNPQLL